MNRTTLQLLAKERIRDAEILLSHGQWSGAYYMAGYALECGLKSCILRYLDESGVIFVDIEYPKKLGKCWTHDLQLLLELANLKTDFENVCHANPTLEQYWGIAKDWKEVSRYAQKTRKDAEELIEAITNKPDGVLTWIEIRW